MTIRSISKLFSKEVGTRNYIVKSKEAPFPNIALCPYIYAPGVEVVSIGKNMTFDDVMKLPSIFDHVVISVEISKAYSTEHQKFTLNNKEEIENYFNVTLDDIW